MPSGRAVGWVSATGGEIEPVQRVAGPRADLAGGNAVQAGVKFQIGADGEFFVQRERLRHVADPHAGFDVARFDGAAEKFGASLGGWEQAGQHLHRRGLAAAVGAEEAEDLAALDPEADVIDGGEIAEPARQTFGEDGRRAAGRPSGAGAVRGVCGRSVLVHDAAGVDGDEAFEALGFLHNPDKGFSRD